MESAEDEPAENFGHSANGKCERTRVFFGRSVNQTEPCAVGEQADGHAGFAQEALEFLRRRCVPVSVGTGCGLIEVHRGCVRLDEEQPRRRAFPRTRISDGVSGLERFVELRE